MLSAFSVYRSKLCLMRGAAQEDTTRGGRSCTLPSKSKSEANLIFLNDAHSVVDERSVCAESEKFKKRQIPKNVAIGCVALRPSTFWIILHPAKRLHERDPPSDKVAQGRGRIRRLQEQQSGLKSWSSPM